MLNPSDFKEFLYAIFLIAGFSVAGLISGSDVTDNATQKVAIVKESPHAVPLIANPVVHIAVPAHNIFEK